MAITAVRVTLACCCLQARLADATRQLLGGSAADGGLGAAEVRQKLAAAEKEAARTAKALSEAETKVCDGTAALPSSCDPVNCFCIQPRFWSEDEYAPMLQLQQMHAHQTQ